MFQQHLKTSRRWSFATTLIAIAGVMNAQVSADNPTFRLISGIDPQLAYFNNEGECGTGAVVPWADRLWVITYAPHKPEGSSDKLYEITAGHQLTTRPESIGGTPANRMVHPESNQLFIGPYVINAERRVRVIPPSVMYGRLTGNARHLFDPIGKIYFATMEEGFYEVDVNTLAVTELWTDEQKKAGHKAQLPGYHGKGLYSGQGRLIYANNGERGNDALTKPETSSGVLASWDGKADAWTVVRRNQFTEVTGPGGLQGNIHPATDPIWSIGWDHRSLILEVFDAGKWHAYRLPKSSHSYDGAHGWNTEWPRIREIGDNQTLMTMHGCFWKFPNTFSPGNSSGLTPRSNYLKVVGDFCRWGDDIVLGCDDAAHSEFLNKRKLKGKTIPAGQSQSNLQFRSPQSLDDIGPVIGRGAVWLKDDLPSGSISDPYLFTGYDKRTLHLSHESVESLKVTLEVDLAGDGTWSTLEDVTLEPGAVHWMDFATKSTGQWIRLKTLQPAKRLTAFFQYANQDHRTATPDPLFHGLAESTEVAATGGLLHARGDNLRVLRFVARNNSGELGGYDLDGNMKLIHVTDPAGNKYVQEHLAVPQNVIEVDAASVLYIDDAGRRWRLPKGSDAMQLASPLGLERVCREVCTERDLLNVQGTFYELPAENAGGFAKLRPVATHEHRISDFTSYRGLLVMSGVKSDAKSSDHIIVSDDGRCALWVGSVDDLWKFGKPRGTGGPWMESRIEANVPSDPYLITGYDKKTLVVSQSEATPVKITLEADFTGQGDWSKVTDLNVPAQGNMTYHFPDSFNAYWVRLRSDKPTIATAIFDYN